MRLYLSKDEGILLKSIISQEIQCLTEMPFDINVHAGIDERIYMLDTIYDRIEECLCLQKTGYNRKEK